MGVKQKITAVVLIVFIALLVVELFNGMEFSIEAFQFEIKLELLDHGRTEIFVPPIGSISAKTHKTPIGINITLISIDLDLLGEILKDKKEKNQLVELIKAQLENIFRYYILRLLLLAFLGGIAGALLLQYKSSLAYLRAGLVGITVLALLLLGTYNTYQIENFNSSQYKGALKAAPWMVSLAEEAFAKVQDLGEQMEIMASNFYAMFERIEKLEPLGDINGDIRILHVSDIHNNPAIFDLIKQIVNDFGVNFIIDTGDLSDFGTVIESLLTDKLATLPVPYIFVPGNHDSPVTVEALQKHENVIVLDGEVLELEGLKIFGLADPASYGFQLINSMEEQYPGYNDIIKEMLEKTEVDIIAVHRPKLARNLAGLAPIILHGHDHRQQINMYNGSYLIDAGTSGAAGLRSLQVLNEVPYTLVLLHINKEEGMWVPKAADVIKLDNGANRLSLERVLLVY